MRKSPVPGTAWRIDDEVDDRFPLYVRAQVYRTVVTPLARSSVFGQNDGLWRSVYVDLGIFDQDELARSHSLLSVTFGGYVYSNIAAIRVLGVRTPGLSPEVITTCSAVPP